MADSHSQSPTASQMELARALLGLEAAIHLVALPVAMYSLALLARTSVLHFNLKFLLLAQTAAILLRSLLRLNSISVKFVRQNPFWSESEWPALQFGLLFAVFFRNFLGHVIASERMLATVHARNYEWQRRFRWFSPGWFFPLMLLGIWNGLAPAATGGQQSSFFALTSAVNLVTGSGTLLFNLIEFLLIGLLFRYNRRRFAHTGAQQNEHNLSERYQLLENVRTTRQLLPVLALHSLSNLNNSGVQLAQVFKPFHDQQTIQFLLDTNIYGFFIASILTLAMLLATIICHPILRLNATRGLRKARNSFLGRKGSVGPERWATQTSLWNNAVKAPMVQQRVREEYFKVLNNFWETEALRKNANAMTAGANSSSGICICC